jgi:hypothetical protein
MCFKAPEMPEMPKVTTTARELLPSWENVEPTAPVFGGQTNTVASGRKGKAALKIDPLESTNKAAGTSTSSPYFAT